MKNKRLLRVISALLVALMLLPMIPANVFSVFKAEAAEITSSVVTTVYPGNRMSFPKDPNDESKYDTAKYDDYTKAVTEWDEDKHGESAGDTTVNGKKIFNIPTDSEAFNYNYSWYSGYKATKDTSGNITAKTIEIVAEHAPVELNSTTKFLAFMQLRLYAYREDVTNPTLAGYEFKLTKDLDFLNKGWCKFNPNAKFGGTFDGQNHIIGGISMKENGNSISVFGSICDGAVFKNVTVIGSIALGSSPTSGKVAGRGVFTNIATSAGKTVTVYDVLTALTITDSSTRKIERSGGLAGYVTGDGNLLVSDIKFSGSITAHEGKIGGIIGSIEGSANVQLQRIYSNASAAITATGDNIGGFIGYAETTGSVTVKDCNNIADDPDTEANEAEVDKEASVNVTATGSNVGGVIGGVVNESAVITLTNIFSESNIVVKNGSNVGGLIGCCTASSVSLTGCTYAGDGEKTGFIDATAGSNQIGGLIGTTSGTGSVILNNCTVGGSSEDGLKALIRTYSGTSKVVRNIGGLIGTTATSTVSMTNCLCNSNTAIYSGQAYNIGLVIGHAAGTTVTLTETQGKGDVRRSITGDTQPSIATADTIVAEYKTANDKTTYYSGVGGVIGRYDGTGTLTLNDCNSSSGVNITTWNQDVGGVIGYATGTVIIDSTDSSGKIVAYNPAVGGFVGYFKGTSLTVRNGSRFRGTIESNDPSGKSFVGGIVGRADESTVEINGSINGGDITMELNATVVGGFVGYIYYSTVNIESCFTASNIAIIGPTADRAGAVAGMIEGNNGALNINNVLIAGKISVTNGTASSVNAIVPCWNGIATDAIKMSNSLIVTDMSESGSNANIFTALYNAGNTQDELKKGVRNPVCTNSYFIPQMIRQGTSGVPATAIIIEKSADGTTYTRKKSGDEPANMKSWAPANINKDSLGSAWVSAGAFVQYPVPAPTKSYANTYFKVSEKDISVEAVGKQIQDNGDGTSDHRFVAVVRNYIAGPFGIGFQMTVNYDGLAAPVTQTFYCTKGYKNLNDTVNGTISATLYNADFFVTLTVTDVPNELYDKNLTINITPLVGTKTDSGVEKRLGTEAQYVLSDAASEYTYLKVMSFNIQGDIDLYSNVISGADRQAAVVQEMKEYDPDILGLQEDNNEWESYLKDKLSAWTFYDINVNSSIESECRLFVKDGLASNVVLHGSMPYDGGASNCALTYADVTNQDGPYYLTTAERDFLELYDNTDFLEERSWYNQYNNASHTSYSTVSGGVTWRINGSYSSPTRSMNYVVLLLGDTYVMYVNTHLMHRAQNDKTNGYYSDADNKIYNSPVQKLRSFERQKSIDMLDKKVDEVKAKYANTGKGFEVIITGDMNDYPTTYVGYKPGNPTTKETSLMYQRFIHHGYKEAFAVAEAAGNFIGGAGTGNAAVSTQKLADLNLDGNRLDYCFYTGTSHLTLLKHEHANGYVIKNGKYLFTSDHRAVISTFRVVYKQTK